MEMFEELTALVSTLVYIFIIVDPLASLPVFITLTKDMKEEEMKKAAREAVFIAGVLAFVFILGGNFILKLLGVDLPSFRIAGGIVLGLLGLETVLGFGNGDHKKESKNAVVTLIATPMLTGPGLITALIIMSGESGVVLPMAATGIALLISWLILDRAVMIKNILGVRTIEVFAKVFGLFLVALGISYIKAGLGA